MTPGWRLRTGLAIMLMTLGAAASATQVEVVGYMPAWKNLRQTVDQTDLSQLSHINVAFLNPDATGALRSDGEPSCMRGANAADLHYLVGQAHAAQVQVLVSLGGGVIPPCSGDWQTLLAPDRRQALVDNLLQFVADFDLDGLDVDLEGVLLTAIDKAGNYTPFVEALSQRLKPQGKLLTCATASYEGGMVPVATLPMFDFVNIMSYDAIGPSWGPPGVEHSTYEQALQHIAIWQARGLSRDKLVLGVPFYGYGFGTAHRGEFSYGDILATHGESASQVDVIGEACAGCDYITYNGAATIRRKTRLALQQGVGVMIWEMSHDAATPNDLLGVIHDEIHRVRSEASPSTY